MSEHIPGPWQVREDYGRRVVHADQLGPIAILAEHDVGSREWALDDAIAHLIVAAPALLGACQAALASLDRTWLAGGLPAAELRGKLVAAIAQATGETP